MLLRTSHTDQVRISLSRVFCIFLFLLWCQTYILWPYFSQAGHSFHSYFYVPATKWPGHIVLFRNKNSCHIDLIFGMWVYNDRLQIKFTFRSGPMIFSRVMALGLWNLAKYLVVTTFFHYDLRYMYWLDFWYVSVYMYI